jgi:DNA-binding IclR family transcriptional regulator
MSDDTELQTVASVERALALLDCFTAGSDTLSLTQLAQQAGLYKSTVLRLAQTLEHHGYLARTREGAYHIGPAPLRLARLYQAAVRPEDVIVPLLRELVEQTRESAGFHIRFQDMRLCLYRVDSPEPVRDHFRPGDALPLDRGAGGEILAAFGEPRNNTLEPVRRRMFAVSRGAIARDMGGVAVPVFNASGALEGAITLSGLARRYDESTVAQFRYLLLDVARRATRALGGDTRCFDSAISAQSGGRRSKKLARAT